MASINYEALSKNTFTATGTYSRDISVESAALNVMADAYKTKKPVSTVNIQTEEVNVAAPNPFSGSVYPTEGTTPVVQNMGEVPVGTQIAPGISEVAPVVSDFQPVTGLENPVDMMVNDQNPAVQDNIVQFPQNMDMNNQYQAPVYNTQFPQQKSLATVQSEIDEQLQAIVAQGGTEEQIREVVLQKINGIIANYVDFIGRGKLEDIQRKEAALDERETKIQLLEQGLAAKLSGQYGTQQMMQQPMGMQQPMMGQPIMQQTPQQSMYPTQQNMITETPMTEQPPMQQMPQQPTMQYSQGNNSFKPVV